MTLTRPNIGAGLIGAFLLFLAVDAFAQNCGVSVTPVLFGSVDAMPGAPVDSTGSISMDCDTQVSYRVRIDPGLNGIGGFSTRRMQNTEGFTFMDYNLFVDSSRALIWGDGSGGSHLASGLNPGIRNEIFVYGRIAGGQNLSAGEYQDSVVVVVEW